jgi:hypothetical protein
MGTAINIRCVPGDEDIERVRGARRKLRQVRQILMTPSPEQLGECGPVLEEAADLLGSLLEGGMSSARGVVLGSLLSDELQVLRRELTVVTALMHQAAGYYLGWAQMLGAAIGGYTSHGDVPPLAVESRLSVEG